ncbi:ATPase subunit HslU [Seminavis robusta]|uniref:ATPase subunit HslU n=1 Tax=Seminavis robusta TaxID=568900 RepID=A0A9N8HDG4_9STRA|nr:ATPase subunit HslU [Seminavis robusta]|eukprot:Sro359_g126030.1 ATPase subunit HslU (511) ;mRNA; r:12783-14626
MKMLRSACVHQRRLRRPFSLLSSPPLKFVAGRPFSSIAASANEQIESAPKNELQENLRPTQIVDELNKYVVGQADAKRAVAIALRNRWRRRQLPEDLRKEIMPRNVLLVGPTGCGKTEVARRMAMLNDAPFIKVEATKFTEVGYHGRDVDKIIADLMDISMQLTKKRETEKVMDRAKEIVEELLLEKLIGPTTSSVSTPSDENDNTHKDKEQLQQVPRNKGSFQSMLEEGLLDEMMVEVEVPIKGPDSGREFSIGDEGRQVKFTLDADSQRTITQRKKLPVPEARKVLLESECEKLLQMVDLKKEAITAVEETGIVFIDEIDKICTSSASSGRNTDASAEGVQRDLLPLVEGTTVSTKHGNIKTDYILFVASGAFHSVKPSDLLPELQGRLPVRVELKGLTEEDLYKILTEPVANMIRQQVELLKTEGVELEFEDEAIREIAKNAAELNKSVENIGARRLHTVMERIMEEISFEAAEEGMKGTRMVVDKEKVGARLKGVTKSTDLSRFIL